MIHECAEIINEKHLKRARTLGAALLSDGIKKAGLNIPNFGCMDPEIMPVNRGMTMVGTALTVETDNGDNFPVHLATYAAKKEGYVIVIDGKGYKNMAYLGDLIIGACQVIGFKGIVIDGYTRDRDGNIELDFPVYCRGFMPSGPIKKNEGNVNTQINCGGIPVKAGDLVVGDSDGVTVVPREHIERVLDMAEEKLEYENKRKDTIAKYKEAKKNGTELPQLAPQWVIDMLAQK